MSSPWRRILRDRRRARSAPSSRSGARSGPSRRSRSSRGSSSAGGVALVRRPSERVQALALVAVLIVAIAGLYASVQRMQPASVPSALVRDAALDVRGNGWSLAYRAFATVNNTVFGLLLEASAALRFSVQYQVYQLPQGVLVTAINGTSNGEHGR